MDYLKLCSKSDTTFDSLIQTARIYSEDTGMEFGIDKCVILVMKRRRILNSDGTKLPNEKVIKSLEEDS